MNPQNAAPSPENEKKEKRIRQIVSDGASQNKPGLFGKIFFMFIDVINMELKEKARPAVTDMIVDMLIDGIQNIAYSGDSRKRSVSGRNSYDRSSYRNYQQISSPPPIKGQRAEPQKISKNTYSDITVKTRSEADDVLDYIAEIISQFRAATVADLYDMVGIRSEYTDQYYGWTDIQGAYVQRDRDGWLVHLPKPTPLN